MNFNQGSICHCLQKYKPVHKKTVERFMSGLREEVKFPKCNKNLKEKAMF